MTAILVTDGEERSALAVARALGREGHHVYVASAHPNPIAGASRYVEGEAEVRSPLADAAGFVADLSRLVTRWGIDILLPVSDAALWAVLERAETFQGVRIPFAPLDQFRRLADKETVLQAARELNIGVPMQRVVSTRPASAGPGYPDMQFPVVLKPARSVVAGDKGRFKTGVVYARDPMELQSRLLQFPAEAYPVLLQQRIVGPGLGIFLLVWNGQIMAQFAHRRLREKPPSGGVSVYRESVAADPVLLERSKALLDRFQWQGVAMVEYKQDAATGEAYLMEINGRFWGSLQLALDAGVDFPGLLVSLSLGEEPKPTADYRVGVRSRWWWGDVDHILTRLRHRDSALALPPGSPGRFRTAMNFLIPWRPRDRFEILRLHDPAPFARETVNWLLRR